jgi:hypothetical protein
MSEINLKKSKLEIEEALANKPIPTTVKEENKGRSKTLIVSGSGKPSSSGLKIGP